MRQGAQRDTTGPEIQVKAKPKAQGSKLEAGSPSSHLFAKGAKE